MILFKHVKLKKKNDEIINNRKKKETFLESLENKTLYLDSNVFMDDRYEKIFSLFKKYKLKIVLLNEQYNEICNMKSVTNSDKSFKARNAFRLIEEQLDIGNLIIKDLDISAKTKAYADPELIKIILKDLKNHTDIVFITEDMDLKIRLKSQIDNQTMYLLQILSFKDLKKIYYFDLLRVKVYDL